MTNATLRRTTALAEANARLLMRNSLTLVYATVLPLLPLVMLVIGPASKPEGRSAAIAWTVMAFLTAWLFPVYYNLLSMVVTRRDELVLKRLRTGAARDVELVVGMAAPGVAIVLGVSAVIVAVGVACGLPAPVNPILLLVTVLGGCAVFAALALWTAAWTRTAESAQLTSMPVIVLAVAGTLVPVLPEGVRDYALVNPVTALDRLVRVTWFGRDGYGAGGSLSFADTWVAAGPPLLVVAVWTVLSVWLARRWMRWEPRA
jgi:ABC-2 type transport system permease protein